MLNPFAGRFFAQFGVGIAAGIAIGYFIPATNIVFCVLVAIGIVFVCLKQYAFARLLAFMLAGVFLLSAQVQYMERQPHVARYGVVKGEFNSYAKRTPGGAVKLVLSNCTFDGVPLNDKVEITARAVPMDTQSGNEIIAEGMLITLDRFASNPYQADPRIYYYSNKIGYKMSVGEVQRTTHTNLFTPIFAIRSNMEYALSQCVREDEFAILRAMLFGDTSQIEQEELDAFRTAGIAHLLAVSGLHVGILIGALSFLLGAMRIRRWWRLVICGAALALYCALSGFSASVLRASVMMLVMLLGGCLGERVDALNSLGFVGAALLLINPISLFSASFLLSYSAVLGITLFTKAFSFPTFGNKPLNFLADSAKITICAQGGILPAQMSLFGTISPLSFLSNILVAPFVALALICALLAAIVGCFSLPAAQSLAKVASLALFPITWSANLVGGLPLAQVTTGVPNGFGILGICVFLFAMSIFLKKAPLQLPILAIGICLSLAAMAIAWAKPSTLVFLDAGGDAIVLRTKAVTVLLDSGTKSSQYSSAQSVVLPYLRKSGYRKIDMAVLTVPHSAYYNSMADVLEGVQVDTLLTSQAIWADMPDKVRTWIEERGVAVQLIATGDKLYAQQAVLTVLEDSAALPMRLEYDDLQVLLASQMNEAQARFVAERLQEGIQSDILKASFNWYASNQWDFLQAVAPSTVIEAFSFASTDDQSQSEDAQQSKPMVFDLSEQGAVTVDLENQQIHTAKHRAEGERE